MENKNHWYDGWFYDRFIAPNQDRVFDIVKTLIDKDSSVLDVGTGTGRLVFQLSGICRRVDGVDLSIKNIEKAIQNLSKNPLGNVRIIHSSIEKYLSESKEKYDYAILSYVIHEIGENKRTDILLNLSKAAGKIILIDYLYPRPTNAVSLFNEAVEFAAGYGHYAGFKSYIANKGIAGLAEKSGLKIINEIKKTQSGSHVVVLTKRDEK